MENEAKMSLIEKVVVAVQFVEADGNKAAFDFERQWGRGVFVKYIYSQEVLFLTVKDNWSVKNIVIALRNMVKRHGEKK